MKILEIGPGAVKVLKPIIFRDSRGFFYESLNVKELSKILKKKITIKQSNVSFSKKNVFRGFHFQKFPYAQEKLVRVLNGKILDILISVKKILYIPNDFAHGFLVLSKTATIEYFVTNYYSKKHERNINLFDDKLKISKKILKRKLIMSDKDKTSNF